MSRVKKSRSLKRVTGGVKTGSKERTKLENKQRKAKQKAANPVKTNRQRSVYQKFLDENAQVDKQHANKAVKTQEAPKVANTPVAVAPKNVTTKEEPQAQQTSDSLWDQLEQPTNNNTF